MKNIKVYSITLEGYCAQCGKRETRTITPKQLKLLHKGNKLIQEIFPPSEGYSPAFREFFLGSNLCSDCWNKLEEERNEYEGGEVGDYEDAMG